MHDIAGLVAVAILGLWIAYLVPHRLRYRQQLLESRAEDRFSGALRVLVVADARRDQRATEARAECGPDSPKRSGLLSPARGVPVGGRPAVTEGRGGVVERPYGTQARITAEEARRAAQLRAQRAATLSRRAAAARRRALLTGVLAVASLVAWAVVGLTSVGVMAAVVPTVLLAGVVALGRRAAVQARVADAAWERQQQRAARPEVAARPARVTGRAQRPSDSHTEVIAQVGHGAGATSTAPTETATAEATSPSSEDADDDSDVAPAGVTAQEPGSVHDQQADAVPADRPADQAEGANSSASAEWSPVPVPRPTYTTKATAPRREPAPLVVPEPTAPALVDAGVSDAAADTSPSIDLDAILARRRAAGE